jgi:transcriptional regulator with XRE-family HTH domain
MLSLIERGEANPTAVVLERLAFGLEVPLAQLFDRPGDAGATPTPISRYEDQQTWQDPASGYRRRNVSPPGWPTPLHIVEVEFPAGSRIAYETGARAQRVDQQIWVLRGSIDITYGEDQFSLRSGDCLAMELDRPIVFSNPGNHDARYVVALVSHNLT